MAGILGIDNSIGWAHWQLRGGWKNTLGVSAGYAGVVVAAILISLRMNPNNSAGVLSGWKTALLGLQGAVLVLYGSSRVSAAIRTDAANRMLESHRLMPVSPMSAVSGYLWGPTIQASVLALVTFVIGAVVTIAAGIPIALWIGPNIIMATFAVFCWVTSGFAASLAKGAAALLVLPIVAIGPSEGTALVALTGLNVLLSPLIGHTIFTTRTANAEFGWPLAASLAAQAYIAAVLYVGIARKYRRTDEPALAVLPGMALSLGWVAISALAILRWEDFQPEFMQRMRVSPIVMLGGSLISATLLAIVPVANAARRRWGIGIVPVALANALLMSALVPIALDFPEPVQRMFIVTSTIVTALLLSTGYLLGVMYRATQRAWVIACVWIVGMCAAPILIDAGKWALQQTSMDFEMTSLSTFSPLGAWIVAYNADAAAARTGIFVQCGLAVAWMAVYYLTHTPRRS